MEPEILQLFDAWAEDRPAEVVEFIQALQYRYPRLTPEQALRAFRGEFSDMWVGIVEQLKAEYLATSEQVDAARGNASSLEAANAEIARLRSELEQQQKESVRTGRIRRLQDTLRLEVIRGLNVLRGEATQERAKREVQGILNSIPSEGSQFWRTFAEAAYDGEVAYKNAYAIVGDSGQRQATATYVMARQLDDYRPAPDRTALDLAIEAVATNRRAVLV